MADPDGGVHDVPWDGTGRWFVAAASKAHLREKGNRPPDRVRAFSTCRAPRVGAPARAGPIQDRVEMIAIKPTSDADQRPPDRGKTRQ
jgi:hypothetical protein